MIAALQQMKPEPQKGNMKLLEKIKQKKGKDEPLTSSKFSHSTDVRLCTTGLGGA